MARMPVVADRFYPGDPEMLRRTVLGLLPRSERSRQSALAVVTPHAGYVYSGAITGETMAQVAIPETVVILGPNHHGRGAPLGLGLEPWAMPLGEVPVDMVLATALLERSRIIQADETCHLHEHSLEVQVPFLQILQPDLKIVPIVVSHVDFATCQQAARDLYSAIQAVDRPALLVASTDMTHYEPRSRASEKDHMVLERIQALDAAGLYQTVHDHQITMCGVVPTTIILLTAIALGAHRVQLVRYTDSGEVSGDTGQVVGYAGLIIS
jgi:MEMO1 family protein